MDESRSLKITEPYQASPFERVMVTVAKGGGTILAGQLILSATRFVTAILLARLLNGEQFGLYSLAISASGILVGISLLGLDAAQVRYVAISASRNDESGIRRTFQIGVGLSTLMSVITSTFLFASAYLISERVFHEPKLAPLLQFVSIIVPFLVLSEILGGTARGFQKMHLVVFTEDIIQPIIRLALIVALGILGINAVEAVIIFGLSDGVSSLLLLLFLNNHSRLGIRTSVGRRDVKKILDFSIPLWLSNLMITFRNNIETVLIGSLNTITNVGIFRAVSQVNLLGDMFYSSIVISARPMIAELYDRGDREQLGHLYQQITKWVMVFNFPVFLIMILFPAQILSIFGKNFIYGSTALAIMAWANFVNMGTGMCGSVIDMTGYSKLKLMNTLAWLISSLIFNLLLIPRWGIIGAAVTALLVELIINFLNILEVWILFRLLPYNKSILNPLFAGLAAFIVAYLLNHVLPVQESFIWLAVSLLAMLSIYAGVTLGLGIDPEDRMILSHLQKRAKSILFGS